MYSKVPTMAPWRLAREGRPAELDRVLRAALDAARLATWLLLPVAIEGAGVLAARLGVDTSGAQPFELGALETGAGVASGGPAFPRRESRAGAEA